MNNVCECRHCERPVEMTPELQERVDDLLVRIDYFGEMSLTEDQQALVLYGPRCEECERQG